MAFFIDGYTVSALVAYVALCALLRYRQKHAIEAKFRMSLGDMTLLQAYEIQKWLGEQEFPATFSASIFFALFKTYGVPSISRLLVATGQIADRNDTHDLERTSKRTADTSVLITNMVIGRPGSRRAIEAVARTRFLHAGYRESRKISDDDMLYTLSLFVLEPIRWVAQYEWRCLTRLERCAMATCWKALGEDLNIPYDRLPSSQKERGWTDALHWLRELDEWSRAYAHQNVRLHKSNTILASATMDMVVFKLPKIAKPAGQYIVSIILGPDLRNAMG
ncbi:hypothetical protein B0T26DRAFT_729815 [Lasiosphaeria miniovina]|uniref:ER-bound oxygenase mpaB/mpaB'/Rubber oxygenase catalytic domain-containing protein n=1 Tax=Lasiosphaeria miniovina TaxID=1954250 RepID=A0AA39ZT44_9PEZI|nr:uncharacterized protein B0T26DRAFT_729815 [Lasiosphaeria miniovina]KAK0703095.1 hypothetical protein B0T26DRAFT_729815 [Lasiosphaeria miniovina]